MWLPLPITNPRRCSPKVWRASRTLPWDHAAGALWLNEAGGKCARLDGSPYRMDEWDRRGLLGAASPELWDQMAERLSALPD